MSRWRCPHCAFEVEVGPKGWRETEICTGYHEGYGDMDTAHPLTLMQRIYPLDGVPGHWWYWYTNELGEGPVAVAAHNDDEPSALPTMTGSGSTELEAIEDLQANILAWTL